MEGQTKKHENIIKYILLLDRWRTRQPIEEEIEAISSVGEKLFPKQTNEAIKITQSLKKYPRFPLLLKVYQPLQKLTIAITLVYVFFILSAASKSFAYEVSNQLLYNPLFTLTVLSLLIVSGLVTYDYRRKCWEYRTENEEHLKKFSPIIVDLIKELTPLAIERSFTPKNYPIKLNNNDYAGLRLVGSSGSNYHMAYSLSHALLIDTKEAKLMTYMGRLSFFDGLAGYRGGKPAVKLIVSQIAGDLKAYLKRCADWRMQGIDILVRRSKPEQIKRSYIILDDNRIWVSSHHLEELDFQDELNLTKITSSDERDKIISRFNKLWEASQKAEELEAISWRKYFKEKAEEEKGQS